MTYLGAAAMRRLRRLRRRMWLLDGPPWIG
jgi:hypothetical protein